MYETTPYTPHAHRACTTRTPRIVFPPSTRTGVPYTHRNGTPSTTRTPRIVFPPSTRTGVPCAHRNGTPSRGGGVSRKSDITLKTPPEPNLKKGGLGGFQGGFWLRGGIVRWKGTPAPKTSPPPPMKYIVSGTSEQLGMRPRCDPTIRTAPTNVYGRVSSAWVFSAVGTTNLGTVGLRGGHGVRNTPWG